MEQEKIWEYYQNHSVGENIFPEARPRFFLRFLEPGKTALNVGIGSGAFERLAEEAGIVVYALDPSESAILRLRHELQLGERARVGFAQEMPFPDAFFDAVVMSEVLEHMDDVVLSRSLREVFRVLRPGGYFLSSVPYAEDLALNQVFCPHCGKVFHRVGHVQSFDRERLRSLLRQAGFKIERCYLTTFVDWQRPGVRNRLKSLVRWALARVGEAIADPHIIAVARR